nr:hypothetical protein [Micromonospora sp. 4G55]
MARGVADEHHDPAAAGAVGDPAVGDLEQPVHPRLGGVPAAAGGQPVDRVLQRGRVVGEVLPDPEQLRAVTLVPVRGHRELRARLHRPHVVDDLLEVGLHVTDDGAHAAGRVDQQDHVRLRRDRRGGDHLGDVDARARVGVAVHDGRVDARRRERRRARHGHQGRHGGGEDRQPTSTPY